MEIFRPGLARVKECWLNADASERHDEKRVRVVAAVDGEAGKRAEEMILALTEEPEIGKLYRGVIKRIVDFGAFVEILPGMDGLVHISEWEDHRIKSMQDVASEGDEVTVKIINIDGQGKIKLSKKQAVSE